MTPAPSRPARTVFFGSGAFAVPILETLLAHPSVKLVGVVSVPDDARRGAVPVARRASDGGLALLQPRRLRDPESLAAIAALDPELGVLADYGRIVPPAILALPRHGFLNVHPSILPRHRGASPIAAAIAAGDPETGVTIIAMDDGLDSGPIVAAERRALAGTETGDELEADLALAGAGLLATTLSAWLEGTISPRAQDHAGTTMTRPLRREDGRLDPSRPAVELERQVRAMRPWPGTFFETDVGRVIVQRGEAAPDLATDRPGTLVGDDAGLALVTAAGRLRLLQVQPAGGRSMSGADLLRGRPSLAGSAVGHPEPVRA
ncbi:MAG TPA: methionyl-tRNA formyltransferase [Candidatus Eisenbacteria bacterium]|nr:methionyl-tRNA formyltransferase [Candidatus Eisenbacteria bacterium]